MTNDNKELLPYYEKQIAELEYRREIFNDTRKLLFGDEEIDLAKTYNLSGLHLEQILQSHANLEKQVWQAARNPKYTEGELVEILKSANQGMNLFRGETEIGIIISILCDAGAIQVKE